MVFFPSKFRRENCPFLLPGASDEDEDVVCSVCRMPQVVDRVVQFLGAFHESCHVYPN